MKCCKHYFNLPFLSAVKEKLAHDPDSEVATTSLRVSLLCPVSNYMWYLVYVCWKRFKCTLTPSLLRQVPQLVPSWRVKSFGVREKSIKSHSQESMGYCIFHNNSVEFILECQRPNCVLASINQTSDAKHRWRNQLMRDQPTNQHLWFPRYIHTFKPDADRKRWNLYESFTEEYLKT